MVSLPPLSSSPSLSPNTSKTVTSLSLPKNETKNPHTVSHLNAEAYTSKTSLSLPKNKNPHMVRNAAATYDSVGLKLYKNFHEQVTKTIEGYDHRTIFGEEPEREEVSMAGHSTRKSEGYHSTDFNEEPEREKVSVKKINVANNSTAFNKSNKIYEEDATDFNEEPEREEVSVAGHSVASNSTAFNKSNEIYEEEEDEELNETKKKSSDSSNKKRRLSFFDSFKFQADRSSEYTKPSEELAGSPSATFCFDVREREQVEQRAHKIISHTLIHSLSHSLTLTHPL